MNMNFIDEVNFEPTTIYDLLTTEEEICPISITEGTKVYGDEGVGEISVFSDLKQIGFDGFTLDEYFVSYASIETYINLGDGDAKYVSDTVTVEVMVGECHQEPLDFLYSYN